MSVAEQHLADDRAYARQSHQRASEEPSQHVAVVTCMDARLNIYALLGLKQGSRGVGRGGVLGGWWIVLLFRVSYQYVAGPETTQPASVGLTQKPNATSIVCAR